MARALGLPTGGGVSGPLPQVLSQSLPKAAAVAGSLAATVGVSAGIVAIVVAAVFGFRQMSPAVPTETTARNPIASEAQSASTIPPAPPAAAASDEIGEEIRSLDTVRSALQARTPRLAIEQLDRYVRRFPRGTFSPEATVLRIEALVRDGQVQPAVALAARFRASHPDSPLVDRVDVLCPPDRKIR